MRNASATIAVLLLFLASGALAMAGSEAASPMLERHGERGSVMTYRLASPPASVFAAMTGCDGLRHWLSAAGRELTACTSDPRTGGAYRYEFTAGNGRRFVMFGEFVEVVAGERTVHTEAYEGYDWEPLRVTTTFAADGPGTALRVEIEYPSAQIRDTDFPNLSQALEGYHRLGTYLARRE
jgi:uncharacterized protein YndB with AHSA1/START domain